jgi:hypothetical protein
MWIRLIVCPYYFEAGFAEAIVPVGKTDCDKKLLKSSLGGFWPLGWTHRHRSIADICGSRLRLQTQEPGGVSRTQRAMKASGF